MRKTISLIIAFTLFTVSVTAVNHNSSDLDSRMDSPSDVERSITGEKEVDSPVRCSISFEPRASDGMGTDHGWGENMAYLSCPGEGTMHTDDWIATRLAGGEEGDWKYRNNQSKLPPSVAVVVDETDCPRDEVCYRMMGGELSIPLTGSLMPDVRLNNANIMYFGDHDSGNSAQEIADETASSLEEAACPVGSERCLNSAIDETESFANFDCCGQYGKEPSNITVWGQAGGNDCNDEDFRDRTLLTGRVCHTFYPDSDGDGFGDEEARGDPNLEIEIIITFNEGIDGIDSSDGDTGEGKYTWNVNGEEITTAEVGSSMVRGTQITVINIPESTASERPELVEAIASGSSSISESQAETVLDEMMAITARMEFDKSSPYIYKRVSEVASEPECCFDYNSDVEPSSEALASTQYIVEYGPSPTSRAKWPLFNASYPKTPNIVSESGDCDDADEDRRPGEVVCGETTHFLNPDFDGDGLEDLVVVESERSLTWKIDGETITSAKTDIVSGPRGDVIVLNLEGTTSRAELIDAIASKSGLSKADSKKALDTFTYISMKVAYDELDKSTPYLAKYRVVSEIPGFDRATPEIQKALVTREAKIAGLEERIKELEAEAGESSQKDEGPDADADGDGLSDVEEEETDEPVKRPKFVDRLLSIFR